MGCQFQFRRCHKPVNFLTDHLKLDQGCQHRSPVFILGWQFICHEHWECRHRVPSWENWCGQAWLSKKWHCWPCQEHWLINGQLTSSPLESWHGQTWLAKKWCWWHCQKPWDQWTTDTLAGKISLRQLTSVSSLYLNRKHFNSETRTFIRLPETRTFLGLALT